VGTAGGVGTILRRLGVVAMSMEQLTRACFSAEDDGEQVVAFFYVTVSEVQSTAGTLASLPLQELRYLGRQEGGRPKRCAQ
jgi:hypothetical protein